MVCRVKLCNGLREIIAALDIIFSDLLHCLLSCLFIRHIVAAGSQRVPLQRLNTRSPQNKSVIFVSESDVSFNRPLGLETIHQHTTSFLSSHAVFEVCFKIGCIVKSCFWLGEIISTIDISFPLLSCNLSTLL